LALFGGAIVAADLGTLGWVPPIGVRIRPLVRAGVAMLLLTGALLFSSQPVRCYQSLAFWLKIAAVVLIAVNANLARGRLRAQLSMTLWMVAIFASRAIAYF